MVPPYGGENGAFQIFKHLFVPAYPAFSICIHIGFHGAFSLEVVPSSHNPPRPSASQSD